MNRRNPFKTVAIAFMGLLRPPPQKVVARSMPTDEMRRMLAVQGKNGNWDYDSYMHGMYNGMEYMLSLAENREPRFRDAPDVWRSESWVQTNDDNLPGRDEVVWARYIDQSGKEKIMKMWYVAGAWSRAGQYTCEFVWPTHWKKVVDE